eukprot:5968355-Heterocapsa_arctica.AAC.1
MPPAALAPGPPAAGHPLITATMPSRLTAPRSRRVHCNRLPCPLEQGEDKYPPPPPSRLALA